MPQEYKQEYLKAMTMVDNETYKRVLQMENGDWREVHLYYQLGNLKKSKDEKKYELKHGDWVKLAKEFGL